MSKSNLKKCQKNDYADDDDIKHPGKKVGNRVYCSPNPQVMEGYAGIICIDQDQYKMGFMVRVRLLFRDLWYFKINIIINQLKFIIIFL